MPFETTYNIQTSTFAVQRFVSYIRSRDVEVLELLIPTVRSCLEHRHSYVRKNAVFAIYSIYRQHEYLIPDSPELIRIFLVAESDATCKHHAFVFLANCATQKAVEYVVSVFDQIGGFDEHLQLAIIELIRQDCKDETPQKARYIQCISDLRLLNASSHSVKYESATLLTSLTQNAAAVKASASCFIDLAVKESDDNVKLIVLDRLENLRQRHERVLDPLVMDILPVLSSPDIEVRRKAVGIALVMITSRNVEEVVKFFEKQLQRTMTEDYEKIAEYRQLLIQPIHVCSVRYSHVAASVVYGLMEFPGDSNNPAAVDVIAFVRYVSSI